MEQQRFRLVLYYKCTKNRSKRNQNQCGNTTKKLIIIQIIIQKGSPIHFKTLPMNKLKSKSLSESNQTSFLLLDHIKDHQLYSTLSAITLQFAKEAGVNNQVMSELIKSFAKYRSLSDQPLLTSEQQNNHIDSKNIHTITGSYDQIAKNISFKEQVNFLNKMESQLIHSRQKQNCFQILKKYAAQKQADLMPLLNVKKQTKNNKFKSLLSRKNRGKACTSQNYFNMDPLDLLKNAYQNQNQCYTLMRNFSLLKTMFGHSMDQDPESNCPLYNVLFDQSEKLIISGGQQGAIKIWSKQTGLLLSSLKGHQEYINKLEVTKCNKYICSSAGDGIRFFQLKDMTTFGGWKTNQSIIQITSVYDQQRGFSRFLFGDKKNLYLLDEFKMIAAKQRMLTKDDFQIYKYSNRISKQGFILNIQVSFDQSFVLLGFQHGDILLFHYKDLFTIDPIKSETDPLSNIFNLPIRHHLRTHRDEIRQLKWHSNNQYFVSGGKQGYCLLWEYKNQKTPVVVKDIQVSKLFNRRKKRAFGCNFICFNCTNTHFVAGFMELVDEDDQDRGNGDVIAYSLESKEVIFEFSKDMPIKVASVRGMDTHPTYPNITVICQGTGRILILDFLLKTILNTFELRGFHLLHPHFSLNPGDCRFSKDGKYFIVSTEFGSISIFGYDLKNFYEACPSQQFFASDFTSFTINQKMEPIPIEGDFQIDMNKIQRGQIRQIRGKPYENQLDNNFSKYWQEVESESKSNPIDHKNSLTKKHQGEDEQKFAFNKYLQKLKHNLTQAERFNSFYSKNLQQIEATKQSLLYDEREKQSKVLKKVIEQKLRKITGDTNIPRPSINGGGYEQTYDSILQQIDAKGKRGGRRLTKMNNEALPNYRDEFQYNSANQQEYNIQQEPEQQEQLQQLDYNESSDEIPRTTRRNPHLRRSHRQNDSRSRYNIRTRPPQRYRYDEDQEQEQKRQTTLKRRTPAEDVQEMLKSQDFRDYDMSQGRKRRKTNRMRAQDDDFIKDEEQQSQFGQSSDSHNKRRQAGYANGSNRRRGRPKRNAILQVEQNQSQSHQNQLTRLKKKREQSEQKSESLYGNQYKNQDTARHNLRTRHQNDSDQKGSRQQKKKDLGECYRCAVNPAVVVCHLCECACCENCKTKRGRQVNENKFECFVCTYIYTSGSAIVDQKKLTEQYFRLNTRVPNIYVPQINDEVRFFFQGYEEFLAHNIKALNIEPIKQISDYLLMPHIYNDIYGQVLLETPLCKVKNIRYFFPFNPSADKLSTNYKRKPTVTQKKHINMLINLELVFEDEPQKKSLQRNDFWVFFIPSVDSIESDNHFLLREQVFKYVEENKILQSLQENQTVQIYGQEYQVVGIGPSQDCFPESIWKQITVSKLEEKRRRHSSKESQKKCNVWDINGVIQKVRYLHDFKPEQYQKKLLDCIKYIREHVQDYEIFEDYVDFEVYDSYRWMVQVGICLSSIEQRIKNNYYHSLEGLQFDLDLMVQNSITFNGTDSPYTQTGILIRKEILKILNVNEQIIKKFNPKTQEETPNKRQKRQPKKKDLDQGFVAPEQPYSLRNPKVSRSRYSQEEQKVQPTIPTRNRRKKSQQSFKENSESEFNEKYEISEESQVKRPTRRNQKRTQPQRQSVFSTRGNTSKNQKHQDDDQDYEKQEEVYKKIQNRRNRSRYMDSSYDSNQKNSGSGVYATRRSSRLHH